jgi:hypothetical protein
VQDAGDGAIPDELAELAGDGAVPVPAGLVEGAPARVAVDPDDAAAQPASGPAIASAATAAAAARRARAAAEAPDGSARGSRDSFVWFAWAINGISFVTFQMTLYPPARLHRVPSV